MEKMSNLKIITRIPATLLLLLFSLSFLMAQELPELTKDNLINLPSDLQQRVRLAYEELRAGKKDPDQSGQMAQLFHENNKPV